MTVTATKAPKWTPSQQLVIEHVEGDLLVSAAAGAGKTAVLSERCARLVTHPDPQRRTSVDRLLVLTFTEAAANEMRQRIGRALREKAAEFSGDQLTRQLALVDRASISTIHAFCAKVLRTHFHDAGLDPAFEVIDEDEARLLRHDAFTQILESAHRDTDPTFAANFTLLLDAYAGGDDLRLVSMIEKLNRMLQTLADPEAWLASALHRFTAEGAQQTFALYAATIVRELELLAQQCETNYSRVPAPAEYEVLRTNLAGLRDTVMLAADKLRESPATWDDVGGLLAAFKTKSKPRGVEIPDYDALKKALFDRVNDRVKNLYRSGYFALRNTRAQLIANVQSLAAPAGMLIHLTRQFQQTYDAAKQSQNRIDFADLERHMLRLLTMENSSVAKALQERFDHVLVDEFQDTNPLQATLLGNICDNSRYNGRGNLFVVGDVKQSIYGFRLADPSQFLAMEKERRARATHKAFIALQNNFRTDPALLGHMNDLFSRLLTPEVAGIDYTQGHQLFPPPSAGAPAENPVELHLVLPVEPEEENHDASAAEEPDDAADSAAANQDDLATLSLGQREAIYVAQRIEQLLTGGTEITDKSGQRRKVRPGDIAILMRSVRNKAPTFARALAERGIGVYADLSTGYFDALEVRETLALLAVIDNPCQDIPLATVMLSRMLPFGRFSHDDLATIRLAFSRRDVPFFEAVELYSAGQADSADATLVARLQNLRARLDTYRTFIRTLPLHEALASIYQDAHLLVYAAGMKAGTQRVANLQALHQRARQFSSFRRQGLYRFLQFIDRLRDLDGDAGEAPALSEAADVVRILSIHKSKGLEFPVVIVAGLGNRFNLDISGPLFVHRREFIGLQLADLDRNAISETPSSHLVKIAANKEARAEELRLLYVALTRARQKLILTGTLRSLGTLEKYHHRWSGHTGPLPESTLLTANSQLDYLLPLCHSGEIRTDWPGSPAAHPSVIVQLHDQEFAEPAPLAAAPTAAATEPTHALGNLEARIRGDYPTAADCTIPAVLTVSELKHHDEPEDDEIAAPELPQLRPPAFLNRNGAAPKTAADARLRGTATHRLLELMQDYFADVADAPTLDAFMQKLIKTNKFPKPWADLVDRDSILWFLHSPLGAHLRQLAYAPAEATLWDAPHSVQIRTELSFTYALPARRLITGASPNARISLRGAVDLLLITEAGLEIVDYKTDAHPTDDVIQQYRRQVTLYSEALHELLHKPVRRATLVFLTAREILPVITEAPT